MAWPFRRQQKENDLEREVRAHLELEAEEQGDAGAARREFGNVTRIKEDVREAWGWTMIDRFRQDMKYVLRQMRRSPGFTAIAVLTLALGLGAVTAIFSVVNGVLLEPFAFRDPGQLFLARTLPPARANLSGDFPINAVQFARWRQYCRGCERMALAQYLELTLVGTGEPVRLAGLSVTPDFFRTLGVQPALGRGFAKDDSAATVILDDSLWRSRFNADPSVIGRTIELNGESHIVIGVMPPDLHLPKGDEWGGFTGPALPTQIFRPFIGNIFNGRPIGNLNYTALIRLKPGVTRQQGMAELNSLISGIFREYQLDLSINLIPLQEQVTRNVRPALWLLFATTTVALLIVCVNAGNLMLVRTAGRYREAGVRLALGAGRGRLFLLALEEALALVAIGGGLALAVAWTGLKMLAIAAPANLPRIEEARIDWRVLLFAAGASVLSAVVCGLLPAWRLSRTEPMQSMRVGAGSTTESGGKLRTRELMVGIEVALSTVLLVAGGLLIVSFLHVMRVDKGFDVEHIVTQDVSFLNPKYVEGARRRFVEENIVKLARIPGVDAAAATNRLPLEGDDWVSELIDPDQPPRPADRSALVNYRFVTPEYWKAMGIPLKQGRYLDESDKDKPHAVISERAARFLWGDDNPIGKHVTGAGGTIKLEIAGVVGEVRSSGLEHPSTMMIYEHYWRMQPIGMTFIVRARIDPAGVAGEVRGILARADPEMALPQWKTMEQIVAAAVASRRFEMYLAAAFAASALLLASLGIYGVVSFSVARRTGEIGIRIALGARAGDVTAMMLREGMKPVLAGLAAGIAASVLLGRVISNQLYGVQPNDPTTISIVALTLVAAALVACWFPARRATRIEAMEALRAQ